MELASLKRWQWACLGVALGLIVSLWRGWVGPEGALVDRPTLEAVDFERLLLQKGAAGQPMVKSIRVHSHIDGTYWLTAEQLIRRGPDGPEKYVSVKIPAKTPFVPQTNKPPKVEAGYTVVDWLRSMKQKHPEIAFSTRWWAHEPVRSPMFAIVGMVLLAGLCPPLIGVLTGAGLGRQREEKEKNPEYDLSRFGKGKPEEAKPSKPHLTEQDLAHVRELDAELERRLSAGGSAGDAAAPLPGDAQPQHDRPVQKLTGGPLETPVDDKPKKSKRYGGEFYPTETHVKQDETET